MKTTIFILFCSLILLSACRSRSDDNTGSEDSLSSYKKLTGESEPGECLILEGSIVSSSTETGMKGIKIFVYHTNKDGIYNENGSNDPRINGYVISDDNGKFIIKTIMPGSYPNSQNPRHVHFVIERDGKEQFSELVFEGDPYVTEAIKRDPVFVVAPLFDKEGCKTSRFEIILEK